MVAVVAVAIFFAVTKFGRKAISDSHKSGQQMGNELGKKAGEKLLSLFKPKNK